MSELRFGVQIPTYKRKAQDTARILMRTLDSVLAQAYPRWKIYLIGDNYQPADEFNDIVSTFRRKLGTSHEERLYADNLPVANERERLGLRGDALWRCGGAHASNIAMWLQRTEGFRYTTHLDDDDIWLPNHLQTLVDGYSRFPRASFVYTRAQIYYSNAEINSTNVLPRIDVRVTYNNLPPQRRRIIHSTASWHLPSYPHMPFHYRVTKLAADADMWGRMMKYAKARNYRTLHIPEVTVMKCDDNRAILLGWMKADG